MMSAPDKSYIRPDKSYITSFSYVRIRREENQSSSTVARNLFSTKLAGSYSVQPCSW
jgi:hypothetical protein